MRRERGRSPALIRKTTVSELGGDLGEALGAFHDLLVPRVIQVGLEILDVALGLGDQPKVLLGVPDLLQGIRLPPNDGEAAGSVGGEERFGRLALPFGCELPDEAHELGEDLQRLRLAARDRSSPRGDDCGVSCHAPSSRSTDTAKQTTTTARKSLA